MDFLKKNLGLISYAVVCLILAVMMVVGIRNAARTAAEREARVRRQSEFFSRIRGYELALTRSNRDTALENEMLVEREFTDLRRWLAQNYAIPMDRPPSSLECVRLLQQEIRRMNTELEARNVHIGPNSTYFSFRTTADSKLLPRSDDVPLILRKLKIVRELVRLVGMSEVHELSSIERPIDLQTIEEDLYTITPLELKVIGRYDSIEKLINLVHRRSLYLFFLRSVSLASEDQAPGGHIKGFGGDDMTATTRMRGARGHPGMMPDELDMMMPPDEMDGGPRAPGWMPRHGVARPMPPPPGQEAGLAKLEPEEITRDSLKVFGERFFTASLRLDVVEFREPKVQRAEE